MYNVSKYKEKHFNNIGKIAMKHVRATDVYMLRITELQLSLEHLGFQLIQARFER
jgi:hypothetical protein